MGHPNYFYSWTAQSSAKGIPIRGAKDSHYLLEDGTVLQDMVSTSFQASFGHSEKKILDSIRRQMEEFPVAPPKGDFPLKEEVSRRLLDLLGFRGETGKIFYTVSGAESVENALKVARQVTGRKGIAARRMSYHGASLGALSVTGDWRNQAHFTLSDWTVRIPEPQDDPDASGARKAIEAFGPKQVAAICVETVSGTNGVYSGGEAWWQGLRRICDEWGILLIVDEVLCGFGRTGKPFAFHHNGVRPDMVTMAKAISGGYIPFGALWLSPPLCAYYDKNILACGLTQYGNPLGLAALRGVLDLLESQEYWDSYSILEDLFRKSLEEISELKGVKEVRFKGLLAAIETQWKGIDKKAQDFLEMGLFLYMKGSTLFLAPPLNMKAQILTESMGKIRGWIHGQT